MTFPKWLLISLLRCLFRNSLFVKVLSEPGSGTSEILSEGKCHLRFNEINSIIAKKRRLTGNEISLSSSTDTWNDLKCIFQPPFNDYQLHVKAVPDEILDTLHSYLSRAVSVFHPIIHGTESLRLHLISPFIFHVSDLFKGEVKILVGKQ